MNHPCQYTSSSGSYDICELEIKVYHTLLQFAKKYPLQVSIFYFTEKKNILRYLKGCFGLIFYLFLYKTEQIHCSIKNKIKRQSFFSKKF